MKLNIISKNLRVALIAIAALLPLMIHAQATGIGVVGDPWDGVRGSESDYVLQTLVTPTDTKKAGSASNPYLIQSAADLNYLQLHPELWGRTNTNNPLRVEKSSYYFRQTADIDFGDKALAGPIGHGYGTEAQAYAYENGNKNVPFTGVYDGDGFKIKNLHIDWSAPTSPNNMSFGVFGFTSGAELYNIVLDSVTLGRFGTINTDCNFDVKMGLLVGVATYTRIDNIQTINCLITDSGKAGNLATLMVGGLVGDINHGWAASSDLHYYSSVGYIRISNVYVNCDITLSSTVHESTESGKFPQFLVGGIVGRYRRPYYQALPDRCFFEGTINAPTFIISPTWASSRLNTSYNNQSMLNSFSGEVLASTSTTSTTSSNYYVLDATNFRRYTTSLQTENVVHPDVSLPSPLNHDATRFYGNYVIKKSDGTSVTFNPADASFAAMEREFGVHTIAPMTDATKTVTSAQLKDLTYWQKFQGVNHATYIDLSTSAGRTELVDILNSHPSGGSKFLPWAAIGGKVIMGYVPEVEISHVGANEFEVKLKNAATSTYSYTLVGTGYDGIETDIWATPLIQAENTFTFTLPKSHKYKSLRITAHHSSFESPIFADVQVEDPSLTASSPALGEITGEITGKFPGEIFDYIWIGIKSDGTETRLPYTGSSFTLDDPFEYDLIKLYWGLDGIIYSDKSALVDIPSSDQYYYLTVERLVTNESATGVRYRATVKDVNGTVVAGWNPATSSVVTPTGNFADFTFKWEVGSDPTSVYAWEKTTGTYGNYYIDPFIQGVELHRYYRASWGRPVGTDDVEAFSQGIGSEKKVIFIYDKSKTEYGRNTRVVDVTTRSPLPLNGTTDTWKYFTTFDGINHWTDIDGVKHDEEYPDGDDRNTGYDPAHAVKTMKRAFELLNGADGTTVDDNIIVVMGFYYDETNRFINNSILKKAVGKDEYRKPVTITGKYGARIYDGALTFISSGDVDNPESSGQDSYPLSLQAPMKLRELTLVGFSYPYYTEESLTGASLILYCNNNDFIIDENVRMVGYARVGTAKLGLIPDCDSFKITIVGGMHNNNGTIKPDTRYNADPNWTLIDISSGSIARIIAGGRNDATTGHYLGTPEKPHRVKVKVSITHGADPHEYTPCAQFPFDIGLIAGGQTDGTIFAEVESTIISGNIGRYISGNISYGRVQGSTIPDDSFFGSTTLTLQGGMIEELYGGSLGRHESTSDKCDAYFYGRSVLNIDGATINRNIYGAGAGGVAGVGDCREHYWHHTNDNFIPYRTTLNNSDSPTALKFGSFDAITNELCPADPGPGHDTVYGHHIADYVPLFVLADGTKIPLSKAHCEVNVISGTVNGDIFGGGYGYNSEAPMKKANTQAGNVYGDCFVNIGNDSGRRLVINGNVYGGGAGADEYYREKYVAEHGGTLAEVPLPSDDWDYETTLNNFCMVGRVFGHANVNITSGTIMGDVFAGAKGIPGFKYIASVYGNTSINISGGSINGNVFGGCDVALVEHFDNDPDHIESGNASVTISGGTIGNNVFGGSKGTPAVESWVKGNTSVDITGGQFVDTPFLNGIDATDGYRTFNIYGGGYINCEVFGNSSVHMTKSLLENEGSILNPNETDNPDRFAAAFDDILFRRFCVYGGGYGEKTQVNGNAKVHLDIRGDDINRFGVPDGLPIDHLRGGQTFFDVCGGGYSGNIGRWLDSDGNPTSDKPDPHAADYVTYDKGSCQVIITGYPFIRKVVGGGFYASVNDTDTHIVSGNIGSVIGGALLGYVHRSADLFIGTTSFDYLYSLPKPEGATDWSDEQKANAAALSKEGNRTLYVLGDVFGGNDVKGIVGTTFWEPDFYGEASEEETDGGPLFTADVAHNESKGVTMFVSGGTIKGNVYGAGNGDYRGYYVPGWLRYEDGPARHYREVLLPESINPDGSIKPEAERKYGRVYRSRPMVGSVCMHIGGDVDDRVIIEGNVYGGGRSCNIGQWNTILPFEDPRRLTRGGYLHMNIGSHVTIGGNLYLGVEGKQFTHQATLPKTAADAPVISDLSTLVLPSTATGVVSTSRLNSLGELAYDHWYLDRQKRMYVPGFPAPGNTDGNTGMTGEHLFRGYLKNIEMNGDVELTFYSDPYVRDNDGNIVKITDADGNLYRQRKHWVTAEMSIGAYDAEDIVVTNIFAGGEAGSMTNNVEMLYDFKKEQPVLRENVRVKQPNGKWKLKPELIAQGYSESDIEEYGAIYRLLVPKGVTVLNKVVGGSDNARTAFYPFTPDYTDIVRTRTENIDGVPTEVDNVRYVFEGGLVTQSIISYDFIAYCDDHDILDRDIEPAVYAAVHYPDSYTLKNGIHAGKTIYRKNFDTTNYRIENSASLAGKRYSLATWDPEGTDGFSGYREERKGTSTAIKIGCNAKFLPQIDPMAGYSHAPRMSEPALAPEALPSDYFQRYGGVLYGGCYNSGVTMGDVIINCISDMIGGGISLQDAENFEELSSLKYNIGRVFGGGYGENSRVDGNTYVNVLSGFKAMNVFGGGCRGNVTGKTTINYIGSEDESVIFGAIYGGGLFGTVGHPSNIEQEATEINLISGNVDRVYGGSCLGDLYGRTQVNLSDQIIEDLDHLNYNKMNEVNENQGWGGSRLIVGTVFGGNDIAGSIHLPDFTDEELASFAATGNYPDNYYHTTVDIFELPAALGTVEENHGSSAIRRSDSRFATKKDHDSDFDLDDMERVSMGSGKDTPGAAKASVKGPNGEDLYYNGFPLVGNVYGGSNGDYGNPGDNERTHYSGNTVEIALYDDATVSTIQLDGKEGLYGAFEVPHVKRARLNLRGGTVINGYGGGDNCSIDESTDIYVNYNTDNLEARAGFWDESELIRIWNVLHLASDEQRNEILTQTRVNDINGTEKDAWILNYQIYRLFGGNDHASMAIQPSWHLTRGYIGSLYSGGNFGAMTWFTRDPVTRKPRGLEIKINSDDLHANEVYGGGRVGNILPAVYTNAGDPAIDKDFYGATVTIDRGVVDHVYGGNDVSGYVNHGSQVLIRGAISGDVYCAGNGNYRYIYNPDLEPGSAIEEHYDDALGGRYFVLPQRPEEGYGGANPNFAQRLLAINAYRPNSTRSSLYISGSEIPDGEGGTTVRTAYVRGNVYCGGNSSTVNEISTIDKPDDVDSDIRFKVGSHVMLNGVFLGSNGENLADGDHILNMATINDLDMRIANDITAEQFAKINSTLSYDEFMRLYPRLLDIYMSAVDVTALPTDFSLDDDPAIEDVYIGDFFVGGNRGSMLTDKEIMLTFPESVVIYGKLVGGSNNTNLTFGNVTHQGGLTREMTSGAHEKLHLIVKSRFEPWKLHYPVNGDFRGIERKIDLEGLKGLNGNNYALFPESKCNIYGGCFNSGHVEGNITIDLYSDMTAEYAADSEAEIALKAWTDTDFPGATYHNKKRSIVDSLDQDIVNDSRRAFAVVGGGYGSQTSVHGDIHIRLLPWSVHSDYKPSDEADGVRHPSTAAIFGGSQLGHVIGNSTVEIRDGSVLTNLYGASESAPFYGSTQIILGWPRYYVCTQSRKFALNRADNLSKAAKGSMDDWTNYDGRPAMIRFVSLREGDLCSTNLYDMIADDDKASCFDYVGDDMPHNFATRHSNDKVTYKNTSWDKIDVSVGDQGSRLDNDNEYYGHGNVYGGGYISSKSVVSLDGQFTVRRFDADNNPDEVKTSPLIGYGGNAMILIADNYENANLDYTTTANGAGASGAQIRDHVAIGTAKYIPVTKHVGMDVAGKYVKDALGRFVHQSSYILGKPASDPDYNADLENTDNPLYEIVSDGGIYGGGRKVFTEGFRDCDLAYYGYADFSPQFPKIINTAQRLDLFTVTDCCMHLEGAHDFATNTFSNNKYSLTRIGELRMKSSIKSTSDLDPGERESSGLFNIKHENKRIRNYMAFFHDVLYLAALTSSDSFDQSYRGANGERWATGDFDENGLVTSPAKPSMTAAQYYDLDSRTNYTYRDYKRTRIENYYATRNLTQDETEQGVKNTAIVNYTQREFDQRNLGTAANMIGINNGYTLNVQGAVTPTQNAKDKTYYGPALGVFEIKLLTLARNEGGGYIYALNNHDDKDHFLESPGNFVFPGAAYKVASGSDKSYNYIHDDCFPMGMGWDYYYKWDKTNPNFTAGTSMGPGIHTEAGSAVTPPSPKPGMSLYAAGDEHGDCNDEDCHYWYVNGTDYYFNVTLTAYTSNLDQEFTLDSNGQLIYLYGVKPGAPTLKIDSVTWAPTENTVTDIQNYGIHSEDDGEGGTRQAYDKDYRLYLSVDKYPTSFHDINSSLASNAFVSTVPRADYVDGSSSADTLSDPIGSNIKNNYSDYSASDTNMPLLGISLRDFVENSGKEYYNTYLKEPEKVRLVLSSVDEQTGTPFHYIVNLTINYLLGPTITGHPVIENSALPGEYVYANSFDVIIDLDDDNMAVNARNWYAVDKDVELRNAEGKPDPDKIRQAIAGIGSTVRGYLMKGDEYVFDGDRQIHIPAYRYMDGWNIVYEVVVNNTERFYLLPELSEDDPYADLKPKAQNMLVHNYHRMRPYDGQSIKLDADGNPIIVGGKTVPKYEDLHLTDGALIYIEDDNDMAYFYEWLTALQAPSSPDAATGETFNPQYAEGLIVHLMNNVKMPALAKADVKNLRFRGTFHGNGYNIVMGQNELFLGVNEGAFYNTGFITSRTSSPARIFDRIASTGSLSYSFLYNDKDYATGFVDDGCDGTINNCYRTSANNTATNNDGLIVATRDEFEYGETAYNLNSFYLQKRYNLGVGNPDGAYVEPLKAIYRDGEYRFANWSTDGNAQALRTYPIPNYHDYLGKRILITKDTYGAITGAVASHHNGADLIDETRAVRDASDNIIVDDTTGQAVAYEPNYPDDYLFFGQDLRYGSDEAPYPQHIGTSSRVYRASGFYGSMVDYGFHFNAEAHAVQPTLTAIDFTGTRDAEIAAARHVAANYEMGLKTYSIGGHTVQNIYYPPVKDIPDPDVVGEGIISFETATKLRVDAGEEVESSSSHVSRNLLLYVHENIRDDFFGQYDYDETVQPEDIYAHVITHVNETIGKGTTPLLHLVDREDYNCPIAFDVTKQAWYSRDPEMFSSGANGWEGLYLPFTVSSVRAEVYDPDGLLNEELHRVRDHGEISHFYGKYLDDDQSHFSHDGDNPEPSHEYWLRKFTDTGAKNSKTTLVFNRPASDEDKAANPAGNNRQEPSWTYHFSNTYNSVAFENFQTPGTTHANPQYTAVGLDYENYPMITRYFPYITAYPGPKFREFDLSGEFYSSLATNVRVLPQRINYIHTADDATLNAVSGYSNEIEVTDLASIPVFTGGSEYTLYGTFRHLIADAKTAVINLEDTDTSDSVDDSHSMFRRPTSDEERRIDPFRIYIGMPGSSPIPMPITTRSISRPGNIEDPEPDEQQEEDYPDEFYDIEVYIENNTLIVMSPWDDLNLPLFDMGGRLLRYLPVNSGENRFDDITTGTYLLVNTKFHIF